MVGPMSDFVEIPRDFLAAIATDHERIPTLYFSGNPAIRRVFWQRLRRVFELARRHGAPHRRVLDFGGGGGVLLPTLSGLFERVASIDLVTTEAARVVAHYGLGNVTLIQGDALAADLDEAPFDAIVAADVLEHFRDLDAPVSCLARWLCTDGVLITSLPTENALYAALRLACGVEKPEDHYHTAHDVERYLLARGFVAVRRTHVPFRFAPLYRVTAWRGPRIAAAATR